VLLHFVRLKCGLKIWLQKEKEVGKLF